MAEISTIKLPFFKKSADSYSYYEAANNYSGFTETSITWTSVNRSSCVIRAVECTNRDVCNAAFEVVNKPNEHGCTQEEFLKQYMIANDFLASRVTALLPK